MRVLKFTGTAGSDMREGQGIIALFVHPVDASSSEQETTAPAYPTVVQPACATFFARHPFSLISPLIVDLSVAGVISGNRVLLPPPGGAQKKGIVFVG